MEQTDYRYVFGPVPSRRLGRSLGVDLVPFKVCTYDCIYCQVGCTTDKTVTRREFVPMEAVLGEIHGRLAEGANPDYITMSGSGEPTLYSRLGELIAAVKECCDVPVAVITNGSLLWMPEVRRDVARADLVVPSLDAGDAETFERANRPHGGIAYEAMVEGLVEFARMYEGTIWLEVFLLGGLSDSEERVRELVEHVRRVGPDKIQVNTVVRPPAEASARPVPKATLERLLPLFGDRAEVIADYDAIQEDAQFQATESDVLSMLRRRPCSLDDVAKGLAIHPNEAMKYIQHLLETSAIAGETRDGVLFYVAQAGGQ